VYDFVLVLRDIALIVGSLVGWSMLCDGLFGRCLLFCDFQVFEERNKIFLVKSKHLQEPKFKLVRYAWYSMSAKKGMGVRELRVPLLRTAVQHSAGTWTPGGRNDVLRLKAGQASEGEKRRGGGCC
jgi:hypothetical protein